MGRTGKRCKRRRERGAAIFESMAALLVLCLLFFALLQIFAWCLQVQFCEYSAFYGAKSVALGYRQNFCLRASRVAAIGASGSRRGRTDISETAGAELYMTDGDASGVYYDYWYPQKADAPELTFSGNDGEMASSTIQIENAPLLDSIFAKFAGFFLIDKTPEPSASISTYNYSKLFMEE